MELTERQHAALERGRQALRQVLIEAYPQDAPRLYACAITSAFVQILAASLHPGELIGVINAELAGCGLKVVKAARN